MPRKLNSALPLSIRATSTHNAPCPHSQHPPRFKSIVTASPRHLLGLQLRLQLVQARVEPAEGVDLLLVLQLHVY